VSGRPCLKMLVKRLNWYLAFDGGRVIVAMFVDTCKYVKMPATESRKLLRVGQKVVDNCQRNIKESRRKDKLLPEIDVVVTE
jgi:hypothetical protein